MRFGEYLALMFIAICMLGVGQFFRDWFVSAGRAYEYVGLDLISSALTVIGWACIFFGTWAFIAALVA